MTTQIVFNVLQIIINVLLVWRVTVLERQSRAEVNHTDEA